MLAFKYPLKPLHTTKIVLPANITQSPSLGNQVLDALIKLIKCRQFLQIIINCVPYACCPIGCYLKIHQVQQLASADNPSKKFCSAEKYDQTFMQQE